MFIIHGKSLIRPQIGFVAETCPSCEQLRACRLYRVASAEHLFFLTLGEGICYGHELRCTECSRQFGTMGPYYPVAETKLQNISVQELAVSTNPIASAKATAREKASEVRLRALLKPFLLFDRSYADRRSKVGLQIDWVGGLAILILLFVPITILGAAANGSFDAVLGHQSMRVASTLSIAILLWCFHIVGTEYRRFFCKKLLPLIVAGVRDFNPSESELQEIVRRMKYYHMSSAPYLDARRVSELLQSPPLGTGRQLVSTANG